MEVDVMKMRTLFLLVLLGVIGVFAAVNWSTFTTPTALSLVFGTVQAPLGLVMLGLIVFLTVLFILLAVFMKTSALLDFRRHDRELQSMRELADHAESSRFTILQELFEQETKRRANVEQHSRAEVLARLDKLESALGSVMEQLENSIASYIAELEDKMERTAGQKSPSPGP